MGELMVTDDGRDAVVVRLLDAATDDVAHRGLEGITAASVATRAGVPTDVVTELFETTDDLIGATILHVAEGVVASIEPLVVDAMQGVVDVDGFADQVIPLLASTMPEQVIVQFEAYLATTRRPELQVAVSRIMQAFEEAAALALLSVGVPTPTVVARQFVAVIDGFALHRVAWQRDDDLDALTAALRRLMYSYLADR